VLRKADQIELVESSPEQLRRRMLHGNIYPSERVPEALAHYFGTDSLTALRELALCFLADETEEQLLEYLRRQRKDVVWDTHERILVGVTTALVLVSQGAVQNFSGFRTASTVVGGTQHIPGGPVASMEVIKLLGTNGGSFYGAGGAYPFENPTGFTNMFDLLLVIVLPFAIALMFGRLIGNRRQGRAIVAVMAILFVSLTLVSTQAEAHGNHLLPARVSQVASSHNIGGSMEGKES
jgi:hypothetical protein